MSELKKKISKSITKKVLVEHDNSFTRDENMKLPTIRLVTKKQVKAELIETKESKNVRNKSLLNKKISTMNKRNTKQSNLSSLSSTPNIISKTQGMMNKKKNMLLLKKQNSSVDLVTINKKQSEVIFDKIEDNDKINNDININIAIKKDDIFIDPLDKFFKVSNYKIDNFSPEHSPFGKGNTESYDRFLENQTLNELNPKKLNEIKKNKTTSLFIKAVKGLPKDKTKDLLSSIAALENHLLEYEDDLYEKRIVDNIDRYEQIDNIDDYSAEIQDW
jgi:hypothetical protein